MKKSLRFLSLTLVGILLLGLAVPALGFADSPFKSGDDNKQGPPAFVYEKQLKDFTVAGSGQVKVNDNVIKFDTDPLNKGGRILIPVRAVTEAMGATVVWDEVHAIVTITSADEETIIRFYLEDHGGHDAGDVTVEKDGEDEKTVEIDVKPGLHNNRTYVPLRFISETFGSKVNYHNGDIDIKDGPKLVPRAVSFEDEADITAVKVHFTLYDYEFKGIDGLSEGTGTNDEYTYDEDDAIVTLDKDYIESLTAEKTILTFKFEDDGTEVERTFRINLDFNEDEEMEEPVISPKSVTFNEEGDIEDVDVHLTLNGFTFEGIEGLDRGDEFTTPSAVLVIIDEDYIKALDEEETTLKFVFEKGSETDKVEFEIKLPYLDEETEPSITPHKVKFEDLADAEDFDVTMTLNGFEFTGIEGLTLGDDFTIASNVVTLQESYLEDLDDEETTLVFQFEKGSMDAEKEFEVEFETIE